MHKKVKFEKSFQLINVFKSDKPYNKNNYGGLEMFPIYQSIYKTSPHEGNYLNKSISKMISLLYYAVSKKIFIFVLSKWY